MLKSQREIDEFFAGYDRSRRLFEALLDAVEVAGSVELYSVDDIDEQVRDWLHEAWLAAG